MITRKKCIFKIGPGSGFFSFYNTAMMVIGYCLKHGHVPYFDLSDFIYQRSDTEDPWLSFFDPIELYDDEYVLKGSVKFAFTNTFPLKCNNDPSYELLCHIANGFPSDKETRLKLYDLSKYIKIRSDIINRVEEFKKKHFNGKIVTGIHIRNTDHWEDVLLYVEEKMAYHNIRDYVKYISDHSSSDVFFIATDNYRNLQYLRFVPDARNKIVFTDSSRSSNISSIHRDYKSHGFDPIKIGEDVLIDTLLLSSCDNLIGSYSNITLTASYWNPYLPFTNISL